MFGNGLQTIIQPLTAQMLTHQHLHQELYKQNTETTRFVEHQHLTITVDMVMATLITALVLSSVGAAGAMVRIRGFLRPFCSSPRRLRTRTSGSGVSFSPSS